MTTPFDIERVARNLEVVAELIDGGYSFDLEAKSCREAATMLRTLSRAQAPGADP